MLSRLMVALVLSAGLSAAGFALSHRSKAPVAEPTQHTALSTTARSALPVLPVVHVHPSPGDLQAAATPTLPEVIVHPDADQRLRAAARTRAEARIAASAVAATTPLRAHPVEHGVAHAPLDMPYYSFGKIAPRASRE